MSHMGFPLPWWAKIFAKLILVRIPMGYRFWSNFNMFRHGGMDKPLQALEIFDLHHGRSPFARKGAEFIGLELGPGDSCASAVIAKSYDAKKFYLIDAGSYASPDTGLYKEIAKCLANKGLPAPDLEKATDLENVLSTCNAEYFTTGASSLHSLPSGSVDFIFSNAVLEHVRKHEFDAVMAELRRVLRPDGVCSHRIDLRDHLDGGLNNLRFSEAIWESNFFASSGFYTNRIGFTEMINRFERSGFRVEVLHVDHWKTLPIPQRAMSSIFADRANDDLLVSGFDVLLRCA